ncbi:MAG: hypothetical protein OEY19_06570 [Gammaproteobacteria bacterium]|nr:hypothetical protein [Gammaproteobacteria bacterium]MDH5629496.1 hypothetical protein [Gammaproteobacteria bacterium]
MTSQILINIACTLIGLLIGSRLAIGRDRRKEFNSMVEPLVDIINNQNLGVQNNHSYTDLIPPTKIEKLIKYDYGIHKIRLKRVSDCYSRAYASGILRNEKGMQNGFSKELQSSTLKLTTLLKRK